MTSYLTGSSVLIDTKRKKIGWGQKMEIVIAILFSTVISLGVSLYFRMLGKKEDPLERINKFANKKTNELNEAFGKIQTRFNTIIADFNAQQTQANAAVKLLTQQNKDFEQKIESLDKSIKAVQNIEAQINSYSKILDELNEMSANVEENLLRIQKESVIVNKLNERLDMAGLEVLEARINYLAYAPEIAAVMLRRQQAAAIITAREKIVDGAVSMVKMALDKLAAEEVVELDDEKKAAMVSNLLVVLCADEPAQPVINSGTLNH